MKAIQDEFTDRKISRQRKNQLRRIKQGLCSNGGCDQPIFFCERCVYHAVEHRAAVHKRQKNRNYSADTKLHRHAAEHGLGVFYLDKEHNKQFRWTDKRILRLLKNGGK